ncbi:MAG: SpoIIE family protein phosphatase [Spirochaetales bacterium]|jgi:hypothetical protein|nr:SpoIIE family protein phosphatase [Spirochaetales bacterium]
MSRRLPGIFVIILFLLRPVGAADFYWESPRTIPQGRGNFSMTLLYQDRFYVFWQEKTRPESQEFYLSMAVSDQGQQWTVHPRFLGPFPFTGQEITFYSVIEGPGGDLCLAVTQEDNRIHLYRSPDGGLPFQESSATAPLQARVIPRLARSSANRLILFATLAEGEDLSSVVGINFSHLNAGPQGESWSDFAPLTPRGQFKGTFLPSHTVFQGRDWVVFQSFTQSERAITFQLYLSDSGDGGRTWSPPRYLSDFPGEAESPLDYDNQRPHLSVVQNRLGLSWERRPANGRTEAYFVYLDNQGYPEGSPEQVTRGDRNVRKPEAFSFQGELCLIWFDQRGEASHVILGTREEGVWRETDLSLAVPGESTFPSFIATNTNLFVFWENTRGNVSSLVSLIPDQGVAAPVLRAVNFAEGRPLAQDVFRVRWNSPEDSSGIAGYSYVLSQDPGEIPPRRIMVLDRDRTADWTVSSDGLWYMILCAQDYSGNWSRPAFISFIRDTTPPPPVLFTPPELDEEGMLASNTGALSWQNEEELIAGYIHRFVQISGLPDSPVPDSRSFSAGGSRITVSAPQAGFSNLDNGLWALIVRAVDTAGNIGEDGVLFFRMNKYVPVTFVTAVNYEVDELGNYIVSLTGRGFSEGGAIRRIFLTRSQTPPYDYDLALGDAVYRVDSDRRISGIYLDNVPTGEYRLGLEHPLRGTYFYPRPVSFQSQGTPKFGDFLSRQRMLWNQGGRSRWSVPAAAAALVLLFSFSALAVFVTLRKLAGVVRDNRLLELRAQMLVLGGDFPDEGEKKKMRDLKKKRRGLRVKFAMLVTILVLVIIAMVSIPLAIITSTQQETILAQGLQARTEVLLESITSGARAYLPIQNILELSALPTQMAAMGDDALFVTISARGIPEGPDYDPENFDYVWVTNDPRLLENGRPDPGEVKMDDEIAGLILQLGRELDEQAVSRVSDIAREIARLNAETAPLIREFVATGRRETEEAINAIQAQLRTLDETLNQRLYEIGDRVSSFPEFNPEKLERVETEYIFYKPILFRSSEDQRFFRGVVRLGVSNANILREIQKSRVQIVSMIGLVAVAAIFMGILGSFLLAAIIIKPINILVRGVEQIRDSTKKQELEDKPIKTGTRDELSTLADTINEMTGGLIDAEKANDMLLGGKEVQKQFLPLEFLPDNKNKKTTGTLETEYASVFGYFEGALAVSGDYFDFRQIDDDHIAFIKCDVSGKGVPASLIAVQVASLYIRFFRNWKDRNTQLLSQGKKGMAPPNISELVDQINDNLDYVGIARQGKFAALIVGILNQKTGVVQLCHAGDSIVHIYDHAKGMHIEELEKLPAAGSFPSEMIQMRGGYPIARRTMKPGDALLLYTDGIEEAQRHFYNAEFRPMVCDEPGIEEGGDHNGHKKGDAYEEFGTTRIHEVINQLMKKGSFKLYKNHNPVPDESLDFDFSTAGGTIEEMIIALVSIERIFRLIPDPQAAGRHIIRLDRKIDAFLKAHFVQHKRYFNHPVEDPMASEEERQLYCYYSHLKEDHQFDDLTLVAVQKK